MPAASSPQHEDDEEHRSTGGERVTFVDARNPVAWASASDKLPGAIRVRVDEVDQHIGGLPLQTCYDSARVATGQHHVMRIILQSVNKHRPEGPEPAHPRRALRCEPIWFCDRGCAHGFRERDD